MTKAEAQQKRMCDEQPPSSKTMRYDRQLRLWGDEGQDALENASVCLLNATTLGCETLKSLVLPGVGEVHIVDSKTVTVTDVQTNFFLTPSDVGKARSECVVKTISQLNPETKHTAYTSTIPHFIQNHMDSLKRFSVFIVSNLSVAEYSELAQIAWDSNIPLVIANIVGMYTEIRIVVREHCIIESKPDTPLPDLRLDKPFTELIDFYQNIDFSLFTDTEHAHIPFVVILLKCLEQWRSCHGGEIPKNYKEKKEFKELISALKRKSDEENFLEACQKVNKCVMIASLPCHIAELFEDPACVVTPCSSPFWITAAAVKQFYNVRGVLPVSGVLDDMTADSQSFVALQTLYRDKAASDAEVVAGYVQGFLNKFDLPSQFVSRDLINKFSKNSGFIRVVRTSPVASSKEIMSKSLETTDQEDLAHVVLLFRACFEFLKIEGRWPGEEGDKLTVDEIKLMQMWRGIQEDLGLPADKPAPAIFVKDFVRFGGTEVPSVAAFSGGIAAQECIKLITCQYVPVDNCFVYNGGSQLTSVYKF
ncbi:NEDD8-activating enzyme E1 regulatory subunit-like [Bolinopsis microptera]|uniref:NEDD8-activating enzyme E1 regulatory subunit-like n=1 Tax=Bolinopsis microptera TaxID=2820187 RepID=UPI00307ADB35